MSWSGWRWCAARLAGRAAQVRGLRAAGLLLASALGAMLAAAPATAQEERQPPSYGRGLALFVRQCGVCHGPHGRGDGFAAQFLEPPPRDFGAATFRLVSTRNSLPHDEDLRAAIRDGIPGTAMPAFGHLPEQDLRDLVAVVRRFILENRVALVMQATGVEREEAVEDAVEVLDTGGLLELGPEPQRSLEGMLRGRELFGSLCARCHGLDGRADERLDLLDNRGRPIAACDFTSGLLKGGTDSAEVARRILLGMPGSPMPAMHLPERDTWALVHYLQSMMERDGAAQTRQRRDTLVALRVRDRLDRHMHLDDWDRAPPVTLPLMPMVARRERPETVTVRALHDGERLALRLAWDDPTSDVGDDWAPAAALHGDDGEHAAELAAAVPDDGVAVQLARGLDPPFFGMGSADDEVALLEWRAAWQQSDPGAWASLPVLAPRLPDTGPGSGPYRDDGSTLAGPSLTSGARDHGPVKDLVARGPGRLHPPVTPAASYRGRGWRHPAGWDVLLVRDLATHDGRVTLAPGEVASIAFAVWDASTGDAGPRKSITIWQRLLLEE